MAQIIKIGETATGGERKLFSYMQDNLPEEFLVLANPLVSLGTTTREIDAIIITPQKVYVIETKNIFGVITGDDNAWKVNGKVIPHVINKLWHNSALIKGRIVEKYPRLRKVQVVPLCILTGKATLNVSDARIAKTVINLDTVALEVVNSESVNCLTQDDVTNILEAIIGTTLLSDKKLGRQHHNDNVNPKPDSYYLELSSSGVTRAYFANTTVSKFELRGIPGWQTLHEEQIAVTFTEGGIVLAMMDGSKIYLQKTSDTTAIQHIPVTIGQMSLMANVKPLRNNFNRRT